MKRRRGTYYGLDLLRIICTIAVVNFHAAPEQLPGGYLAVCVFFVMHGYLFVLSAARRHEFSVKEYWKKRAVRLYLPVVITVGLTIFALRYMPDIIWLNEKPETLSVLGCFNNWWQIAAGQSYFARVTESPFTHMWYISLLIQLELILPFIYKLYRKVQEKYSFMAAWLSFILLTAGLSFVIPLLIHSGAPDMRVYYGTDARIFSVFVGMALAFVNIRGGRPVLKVLKKKWVSESVLGFGILALLWLFTNVGPSSGMYPFGFLVTSLLTLLLIQLVTNPMYPVFRSLRNRYTKALASISYEVYLMHYPILFFMIAGSGGIRWWYVPVVVIISWLLHFISDLWIRKDNRTVVRSLVQVSLCLPLFFLCLMGGYDIIRAEDHTKEMAQLQEQLAENEKMLEDRQEEYMEKRRKEAEMLNDPDASDPSSLPVTGIGDSVMLGAVPQLNETFPNGDFDAKVSRSYGPLHDIVEERAKDGTLGNPVVIGIGTNCVLPKDVCEEVVRLCGERDIFWLTTTNNWQFDNSDTIRSLGDEFDNVIIVDWQKFSKGHDEYFYSDGIHLTPEGREAYAGFVKECIQKELFEKRILEEREKQMLGIGDGFLLTAAEYLQPMLENCFISAGEEQNAEKVRSLIREMKESDTLPSKVFLALGYGDHTWKAETLDGILDELSECRIVLVKLPGKKDNPTNANIDSIIGKHENVTVIHWENMYQDHPEYFMPDRIHLNDEGSKIFAEEIAEAMNALNKKDGTE